MKALGAFVGGDLFQVAKEGNAKAQQLVSQAAEIRLILLQRFGGFLDVFLARKRNLPLQLDPAGRFLQILLTRRSVVGPSAPDERSETQESGKKNRAQGCLEFVSGKPGGKFHPFQGSGVTGVRNGSFSAKG